MPPKHQKQIPATADIVDLDSSDDEINNPVNSRQFNGAKFHTKPPTTTQSASVTNKGDSSAANFRPLDDRTCTSSPQVLAFKRHLSQMGIRR
ncbi:hypothetical protein MIMGU_mgv1a017152mg [Erythranthe guttata]|uniref:Uncharacterized protein n=1 Tax=Erythranthe guttata TaxID=4155 RepID=A0A022QV31_ERYGU|nr:hypothetical protein MIMGU_mgv1a017152mg [Erythranthe guttata]